MIPERKNKNGKKDDLSVEDYGPKRVSRDLDIKDNSKKMAGQNQSTYNQNLKGGKS